MLTGQITHGEKFRSTEDLQALLADSEAVVVYGQNGGIVVHGNPNNPASLIGWELLKKQLEGAFYLDEKGAALVSKTRMHFRRNGYRKEYPL